MTEFVAYLRKAADRQFDWDSKVLRKREELAVKKLELAQERPELSRKREGKSKSLGRS